MIARAIFSAIFLTGTLTCFAQQYDTASKFTAPVQLDSYVVKSGFDINAFIRRVRTDTTFYKAFKNLHFRAYTADNDIEAYDAYGKVEAGWQSITQQIIAGHCRKTIVESQQTTGNFFKKNGDYRYYTADLFAYLFLAKDTVCNETDVVGSGPEMHGSGQMAKSEYQLKQLIFNPGASVKGVPFMGDHASIFDEGESNKYDFAITRDTYLGQECYVFRITPKKGYEHKALYDELTTWFRKNDYAIIARNYSLSYSTLVYDFNVQMKVRTTVVDGKLYPTHIDYNGNWHVFTKKRERVRFSADIKY